MNLKEPEKLRNFNKDKSIDSVNGALALRKKIESIIDIYWETGKASGFYFIGIGGTYASCMQAEVYMRGKSILPVYAQNAAEFLTTGNKRFTKDSVVILSSESGTTKEMVSLVERVHEIGAKVIGFIDTPGSVLTTMVDHLITYPKNEQLKFFMACNYLMFKNHEFPQYDDYNRNMEMYLAEALAQVEIQADDWARGYAKETSEFVEKHPDMPHYFI
ncbi:MAG: SIS domain-containing protein, partial [Solobacterium sp.]|nr:SIS domain-containing protein [Solobacterium sp.]